MAKKTETTPAPVDPSSISPQTPQEFAGRGWLYYSAKAYAKAIDDFQTARQQMPLDPDVLYALGLALAVGGQSQEAIGVFEQCLSTLPSIEDPSRQMMMRRLVQGQINRIKTGDWSILPSR